MTEPWCSPPEEAWRWSCEPARKARATGDVDLVLRGDPESLLEHLDASLAEDYEGFSFERNEPQPLELRPHVRRTRVKVAFRTKPFMTLVVEIAPVEAGGDEIEEIAAHDLSTIGLEGPTSSQCSPFAGRSLRSCTPSPSHRYGPAGRTLATGTSSTCNSSKL